MSEKNFRIVLGAWLILGLFINSPYVIYALVALLLFEGVTNIRMPGLVSQVRFGSQAALESGALNPNPRAWTSFEAERGLRLIVAGLIVVPIVTAHALLWLIPWFVGFALIGAGLSGICPMVLALRRLGMS